MLVKIILERKIKLGKEEEFKRLMRELFTGAIHAPGFISGETMQCIEDHSVHVTIGTWKSIDSWNKWINSPERKTVQHKLDQVLAEPAKVTHCHYE